ncbi:unnamed protein product [Amoebophrya sp. A120]|nr:unnamed protein product [Amoebophrya sp. A120]|eukprot:GSA120T00001549001.1
MSTNEDPLGFESTSFGQGGAFPGVLPAAGDEIIANPVITAGDRDNEFSKTTFGNPPNDGTQPASASSSAGGGFAGGARQQPSSASRLGSSSKSSSSTSRERQMCANDPTQVATGFCPELELLLCASSFEALRRMPAFSHIRLIPLHESLQKRRKDPETGEPYALYDLDLQEPIPTVAKLVGKSKDHNCCSLEEAAKRMRQDMRARLSALKDQMSNARVAGGHVDKLIFTLTQEANDRKAEVEEYFQAFAAKLEKAKEAVLDDLHVVVGKRLEALKTLSDRLPTVISVSSEAIDRVQEAVVLESSSELEFLFRRKELDLWLNSVESRLQLGGHDLFSGEVKELRKRSLLISKDDNFDLYLKQCLRLNLEEKNPELDRCWDMVDNLLGHATPSFLQQSEVENRNPFGGGGTTGSDDAGAGGGAGFGATSSSFTYGPTPSWSAAGAGSSSLRGPGESVAEQQSSLWSFGGPSKKASDNPAELPGAGTSQPSAAAAAGASSYRRGGSYDSFSSEFSFNPASSSAAVGGSSGDKNALSAPSAPSHPYGTAPSLGRFPASSSGAGFGGSGFAEPSVAPPKATKEFRFDPNFCDGSVVLLRNNFREAQRKIVHAPSAIAIMDTLLEPGQQMEVVLDELNLFLPDSGWFGITPVRSMACLLDSALYLNLAAGEIWREGVLVEKLHDKLSACEGDTVGVIYSETEEVQFLVNGKKVGQPLRDVKDLLYPFVNVVGKVLRFRLPP